METEGSLPHTQASANIKCFVFRILKHSKWAYNQYTALVTNKIHSYKVSGNEHSRLLTVAIYTEGLAGTFWGRGPKLSINFEEILSRAHGNFEG